MAFLHNKMTDFPSLSHYHSNIWSVKEVSFWVDPSHLGHNRAEQTFPTPPPPAPAITPPAQSWLKDFCTRPKQLQAKLKKTWWCKKDKQFEQSFPGLCWSNSPHIIALGREEEYLVTQNLGSSSNWAHYVWFPTTRISSNDRFYKKAMHFFFPIICN